MEGSTGRANTLDLSAVLKDKEVEEGRKFWQVGTKGLTNRRKSGDTCLLLSTHDGPVCCAN